LLQEKRKESKGWHRELIHFRGEGDLPDEEETEEKTFGLKAAEMKYFMPD
jgi:hypothetical protein